MRNLENKLLGALRDDELFDARQADSFARYVRLTRQRYWLKWGICAGPFVVWTILFLAFQRILMESFGSLAILLCFAAVLLLPYTLYEFVFSQSYENFRDSLVHGDGVMPGVVSIWELYRSLHEDEVAVRASTSNPTIVAAQLDELLSESNPRVRRVIGKLVITILCECLIKMPWDERYARMSTILVENAPIDRLPAEAASCYDFYRAIRKVPHENHLVLCEWVDRLGR